MDTDDLLTKFVDILDKEIDLLGTLRYRLTVISALAAAEQVQLLPIGVREAEIAYEALHLSELVRGSLTVELTDKLQINSASRIDAIATHVSDIWSDILLDRRKLLIENVAEIRALTELVTAALARRITFTEEALTFLRSDGSATYGRSTPRGGILVEGAI